MPDYEKYVWRLPELPMVSVELHEDYADIHRKVQFPCRKPGNYDIHVEMLPSALMKGSLRAMAEQSETDDVLVRDRPAPEVRVEFENDTNKRALFNLGIFSDSNVWISVFYSVESVSYRPFYTMTYDAWDRKLHVRYDMLVTQETGETWDSSSIDFRRGRLNGKHWEALDQSRNIHDPRITVTHETAHDIMPPEVEREKPNEHGRRLIGFGSTIFSDGKEHTVNVDDWKVPADCEVDAVVGESISVWLRAKFCNTSDKALFPGDITSQFKTRNRSEAGRSELTTIVYAGNNVSLSLGRTSLIKVFKDETREAGMHHLTTTAVNESGMNMPTIVITEFRPSPIDAGEMLVLHKPKFPDDINKMWLGRCFSTYFCDDNALARKLSLDDGEVMTVQTTYKVVCVDPVTVVETVSIDSGSDDTPDFQPPVDSLDCVTNSDTDLDISVDSLADACEPVAETALIEKDQVDVAVEVALPPAASNAAQPDNPRNELDGHPEGAENALQVADAAHDGQPVADGNGERVQVVDAGNDRQPTETDAMNAALQPTLSSDERL